MSSNRLKVLLVSMLAVFAVSAIASASASAFKLEWEWAKCVKVAAGTGLYKDAECNALGGAKEFELKYKPVVAADEPLVIEAEGGETKLTAGGKVVTCTAVKAEGTIKTKGEDEVENGITFTGCTANAGACFAFSPGQPEETIVVSDIDTQLVERGGKLADEFKENDATKEFVTIEFEEKGEVGEDSKACPGFPTTKVTGQVAALVENVTSGEGNGDVSLNFPSPELSGNTLKAFGVKASFTTPAASPIKVDCKSEPPANKECEAIRGV
jgi:hypothetical protein